MQQTETKIKPRSRLGIEREQPLKTTRMLWMRESGTCEYSGIWHWRIGVRHLAVEAVDFPQQDLVLFHFLVDTV